MLPCGKNVFFGIVSLFSNLVDGQILLLPKIANVELFEYVGSNTFPESRGSAPFVNNENNSFAILGGWAVSLECAANYPIHWQTNGFVGKRIIDARDSIRQSDPSNLYNENSFTTRLFIPAAESGNAGALRCFSVANKTIATEIYMFVKDSESSKDFLNSNAHLKNVNSKIIPCSVYDPNSRVALTKNQALVTGATFDPRIGFLLPNSIHFDRDPEIFQCQSRRDTFDFRRYDTVLMSEPEESKISAFVNVETLLSCKCNKKLSLIIPENPKNWNYSKIVDRNTEVALLVTGRAPGTSEPIECRCESQNKTWVLQFIESAKIFIHPVLLDIRCKASDYSNAQLTAIGCIDRNACEISAPCLDNYVEGGCPRYSRGTITVEDLQIGNPPASGYVRCNVNGAKTTQEIFTGLNGVLYMNIKDAEKAKALASMDPVESELYTDQETLFVCEAIDYFFENGLRVLIQYKNGSNKTLQEDEHFTVDNSDEFFNSRNKKDVNFLGFYLNLTTDTKAVYCFQPWANSPEWYSTSRDVNVIEPLKAQIDNSESKITFTKGQRSQLTCSVKGKPTPTVIWESNSNLTNLNRTTALKDGIVHHTLIFPEADSSHDGEYICKASNRLGNDSQTFFLKVEEAVSKSLLYGIVAGSAVGFILLLALLLLLWRQYSITRKLLRDLTEEELDQFIKGSPDLIKDFADAHENAEYMPYDSKYEIPIKHLTIDQNDVLGSGAFGIVVRGGYKSRAVAVKMTKPAADVSYFKALLSELKIMIYLGNHPNIVEFLGSFTENIKNRALYIIVELCPGGNAESQLRKYKKDLQVLEEEKSRPESAYGNSLAAEERRIFLTILSWPRQIADGMKYLSSKKVIHGDLAARNILLTETSVAKITDFGLSRQLYQYSNYTKKTQAPLPWRWMAVESLSELAFSTKSDIWSYGVTLWEIYTLGDLPFPEQVWTSEFVQMIHNGARLKKPKYATQEMYEVMRQCWSINPEQRPSFEEISEFFQEISAQNPQ